MSRRHVPAAGLLALAVLLGACGDDDAADTTAPASAATGAGPSASTASSAEPGGSADSSDVVTVQCSTVDDGRAPSREVDPPPAEAPADGTVEATLETGDGPITLTLDRAAAPCTVSSFVSLAEQGYFDDTSCHRLTTAGIFVLQCGDPDGTGAGGPGYAFRDELTGAERYPRGTVAMANAGPDTNGSQFFLVYADTQLPPSYTVFGEVSAGLDLLDTVAQAGSDNANGPGDGHPNHAVTIKSVSV